MHDCVFMRRLRQILLWTMQFGIKTVRFWVVKLILYIDKLLSLVYDAMVV